MVVCYRRKTDEEVSDLQQEKMYLEVKVENLERELHEMRDGDLQQERMYLEVKVENLERELHEMKDGDLQQEKMYLEVKVENLEREIRETKDNTHQQRIRALDLKMELKEVGNRFFVCLILPFSKGYCCCLRRLSMCLFGQATGNSVHICSQKG